METHRVDLEVEEINISEGKAAYIAERGIRPADVFQVLWNTEVEPHFFERYNSEKDKLEYSMLGCVRSGRFLRVAIEHVDGAEWRLVTAFWMSSNRGERDYESA